jgi:hypothetical protein
VICLTQREEHLEDSGIDGKILQWVLGKQWEDVDWIHWLRIGTSGCLLWAL